MTPSPGTPGAGSLTPFQIHGQWRRQWFWPFDRLNIRVRLLHTTYFFTLLPVPIHTSTRADSSPSYTPLQAILLQFPLGFLVLVTILLTGYLSSVIPNIRLALLVVCCLPVIAGCAMIWKSTWYYHAPTPVVGYTLIGFFGPVVSLIISIGMANVAGATKKSFTAGGIFVAYCVGNVRYKS